jgi:hypothetical protein
MGGFNKSIGDTRATGCITQQLSLQNILKTGTKLCGLSPRANYTDRATAACRRS